MLVPDLIEFRTLLNDNASIQSIETTQSHFYSRYLPSEFENLNKYERFFCLGKLITTPVGPDRTFSNV